MSVTGVSLILFLTFHCCMNVAAFFSGEAYNMVCGLLGANWYAIVATLALAGLACVHILYAFLLTMQNRRARGNERYAVTARRPEVSWASQNMLVLGLVVVAGLLLHLWNFWYHMMYAELTGQEFYGVSPSDGFAFVKFVFGNPVFAVLYLIWMVALWFHLTHGFWSSMQTLGLSGKVWLKRWQTIGSVYVTVLMAVFAFIVVAFYFGFAPSLAA